MGFCVELQKEKEAIGKDKEMEGTKEESLPPGFRFHPTDEELINCYLINKISDASFTGRAITDVDLNKCEPWDLPGIFLLIFQNPCFSFLNFLSCRLCPQKKKQKQKSISTITLRMDECYEELSWRFMTNNKHTL